jgi:hypothetical protein
MGGCTASTCHAGPKDWAVNRDGGAEKRQHINAINQLAAKHPNVTKYVTALGGKSAYSTKACLDCHTTPTPGGDIEGVTCENCHGAGSRYLKPHADEKPPKRAAAYKSLGMRDYSQGQKWVQLCNQCHILGASADHQKLANAGHPTGADFDLRQKYSIVQGPTGNSTHWNKSRYALADVDKFLPPRPVAATARPTPPPPPVAEAAPAVVTAPPVVTTAPVATAPPGPGPTPVLVTKPPVSTPTPTKPVVVTPPPPVATTVPPVPPTTTAPVPIVRTPRAPITAAPEPPPAPAAAPVAQAPAAAPEPRTVSSILAAVQGRVINVLAGLLGQNVSVPQRVVPPPAAPRFTGPDAELLRLQQDVIALALEVLSAPPPKSGGL